MSELRGHRVPADRPGIQSEVDRDSPRPAPALPMSAIVASASARERCATYVVHSSYKSAIQQTDRLLSKTEMTVFATELKRSRPEKCE